jgi:hypothetical protein
MMMMILIIMMEMIGRGLLPFKTSKCTSVPDHQDKMIEDPISTIIIGTPETGTTTTTATTIFDERKVKGHDH